MLRSRVLKLRQTCFGSRAQQLFFFFGKKVKRGKNEPRPPVLRSLPPRRLARSSSSRVFGSPRAVQSSPHKFFLGQRAGWSPGHDAVAYKRTRRRRRREKMPTHQVLRSPLTSPRSTKITSGHDFASATFEHTPSGNDLIRIGHASQQFEANHKQAIRRKQTCLEQ